MDPHEKSGIFHAKLGFFARMVAMFREAKKVGILEHEIRESLKAKNRDPQEYIQRFRSIQKAIPCAHNPSHALSFLLEMLNQEDNCIKYPEACFVEAGCFKGGSSAKFSYFASLLGKELVLFDSFEGLPDNEENHDTSIDGYSIKDWFKGGNFKGILAEVEENLKDHGKIEVCKFMPGWFCDTMPAFKTPVIAAFIDVDLASSTEDCLKYLYPLLVPGGVIMSQDGDFPLVIKVFENPASWKGEGPPEPVIQNLGQKITKIYKPAH